MAGNGLQFGVGHIPHAADDALDFRLADAAFMGGRYQNLDGGEHFTGGLLAFGDTRRLAGGQWQSCRAVPVRRTLAAQSQATR